jgi:hypothetical protein
MRRRRKPTFPVKLNGTTRGKLAFRDCVQRGRRWMVIFLLKVDEDLWHPAFDYLFDDLVHERMCTDGRKIFVFSLELSREVGSRRGITRHFATRIRQGIEKAMQSAA